MLEVEKIKQKIAGDETAKQAWVFAIPPPFPTPAFGPHSAPARARARKHSGRAWVVGCESALLGCSLQ